MRILIRDETSNAESMSSTDAASSCIGSGTGVTGSRISVGGVSVVVTVGIIGSQRVTPDSVICSTGTVAAPNCTTQTAVTVSLPVTPVMWNWECGNVAVHFTFQGPTLGCVNVFSGPRVQGSISGSVISFSGQDTADTSGHCGGPSCGSVTVRYTYL
jgi:hypothetical protein